MKQQTAVDWFYNAIEKNTLINLSTLYEQAKAMEKEQIIRFAITCHQDILRDRKAPENLISENFLLFEQYYNETYNQK